MDSKRNRLTEGLRTTRQRAQQQRQSTQPAPRKPPRCPECTNGLGWVDPPYFDENGKHDPSLKGRPCNTCAKKRIVERQKILQDLSKMTHAERQFRFKDIKTSGRPQTANMLNVFRRYVKNGAVGFLTVHGSTGNGKSAVLIASVNECLNMGIEAVYITTPDLLNWIQNAYNSDRTTKDGTALDRLNRLKDIRFLAIDELQAVKMTDWRVEQLENLVNYRWNLGMAGDAGTLFAMNEAPNELKSDRLYSRIMTSSAVEDTVIENNDDDIRPFLKMGRA